MWVLCLGALIIIGITHWVYRWRNLSCNGKLPPGSMGLPLLGETLQFFSPNTSSDIPPFIKQRMKRYTKNHNQMQLMWSQSRSQQHEIT